MSIPSSRGSFPYIVFSVASQPSTCMSKGNHWDACPIKTLLEEVKRVMSCGVTIQVFFPHKCSQLSWCRALNVEVMVTFPDISLFRCLHDFGALHRALFSGVGNWVRYSQGAFASRVPRTMVLLASSPQISYSKFNLNLSGLNVFPLRS